MSSQSRSNRVEVPEAKAAMDRFKTEVASELGVNLKEGYNGDNSGGFCTLIDVELMDDKGDDRGSFSF